MARKSDFENQTADQADVQLLKQYGISQLIKMGRSEVVERLQRAGVIRREGGVCWVDINHTLWAWSEEDRPTFPSAPCDN